MNALCNGILRISLTVVQIATLEVKSWAGMFSVNWDMVESPNIRKPDEATAAYRIVHIPKLQHEK